MDDDDIRILNSREYFSIVVDEKVSTGEKKNEKFMWIAREKNMCVAAAMIILRMRWDEIKNVLWFFGDVLLLPTIEIRTQEIHSRQN